MSLGAPASSRLASTIRWASGVVNVARRRLEKGGASALSMVVGKYPRLLEKSRPSMNPIHPYD